MVELVDDAASSWWRSSPTAGGWSTRPATVWADLEADGWPGGSRGRPAGRSSRRRRGGAGGGVGEEGEAAAASGWSWINEAAGVEMASLGFVPIGESFYTFQRQDYGLIRQNCGGFFMKMAARIQQLPVATDRVRAP
jgi:hypothetical protein